MTSIQTCPSETVAIETRAIMKKGSKTFSLAALLFDRDSREGAELLYTWCRACDDAVDNEPDQSRALARLHLLRRATHEAFRGRKGQDLTFTAFELLSRKHGIEEEHAQALLDGMQSDVEGARIANDHDLELYCYRVAGVVGLMMSKIMGVTDPRAHRHAVDTGVAMQMTNIARDIREDFDRGRIYIPETWGRPTIFCASAFSPHARRLVDQAEILYASGQEGLKFLPLRAAFAVGCAQVIYREIGRQLLKNGPSGLEKRTVVCFRRKLWLMTTEIIKIFASRARLAFRRRIATPARIS